MSETLKDLRSLSYEKIISRYDNVAKRTVVTRDHYLNEITRRNQEKQTNAMLKYTKWITIMTGVISISTIVNVIVAFKLIIK